MVESAAFMELFVLLLDKEIGRVLEDLDAALLVDRLFAQLTDLGELVGAPQLQARVALTQLRIVSGEPVPSSRASSGILRPRFNTSSTTRRRCG